jgi:type IV secretory pathway VirB2 component (pilin)
MTTRNTICALIAASTVVLLANSAAASVNAEALLGSGNALDKFREFITGPLAVVLGIIGAIAFGFMIMFGSEFSGLARRIPMFILGLAFIMGAVGIIDRFRGSDAGMIYVPAADAAVLSTEQ